MVVKLLKAAKSRTAGKFRTAGELLERLGDVPPHRVLVHRAGSATIADVVRFFEKEGVLCELIEGVLVEKTMGLEESTFAGFVLGLLNVFVIPRNLGKVAGADGTIEIAKDLVRIPDVAFFSWDRLPGRRMPSKPVPNIVPNLAIEIWSRWNTKREMLLKRKDYFAAGVDLVWEIDPRKRTVAVYTSLTHVVVLDIDDTLDGGAVLPGFELKLKDLFAELDRKG